MSECTRGCGAPLIDGRCPYCGRIYEAEVAQIDLNELAEFIGRGVSFEEEWDKSRVGTDYTSTGRTPSEPEIQAMSYGPGYDPDMMESDYPLEFEDMQKTLGITTGAFLLLGAVFGFVAPPIALPFLVIGLLAAITGGVRQWRHKDEDVV